MTPKKDTSTDRACEKLKAFFHDQGVDIKISVLDRKDPEVSLAIRPGVWDSLAANVGDMYFADDMAERTQQAGFLLGNMNNAPSKPRSVQIGYDSISAPTGEVLEDFINRYVNERLKGRG